MSDALPRSSPGFKRALKMSGWVFLVLLTLISFAPLASVVLAANIADVLNCQVDEGSIHPCRVWGLDIGGALYTASVLGWMMLITFPGMLLSVFIWFGLLCRFVWRQYKS